MKYFNPNIYNFLFFRCALFPLTVIKTQLQVQFKNDVYKGMFDCGFKIYRSEGMPGLYRGFWISSFQIISGVFYISTYEGVRHLLTQRGCGDRTKALFAGGCASLVGQTIIVPFDVVSQHIMVLGMNNHGITNINPLGINTNIKSKSKLSLMIGKEILRRDGFFGFYRGYTARSVNIFLNFVGQVNFLENFFTLLISIGILIFNVCFIFAVYVLTFRIHLYGGISTMYIKVCIVFENGKVMILKIIVQICININLFKGQYTANRLLLNYHKSR